MISTTAMTMRPANMIQKLRIRRPEVEDGVNKVNIPACYNIALFVSVPNLKTQFRWLNGVVA
jgi:hypothetical protein